MRSFIFSSFSKALVMVALAGAFVGAQLGCGRNAFLESAKKDTDSALLFEARKQMNTSNWADAITLINRMTVEGRADRGVKATLASAYAGKCGLNLIRLADRISSSSGSNFFALLLDSMRGSTVTAIADCQLAETTLQSISAVAANRTADENVMLAFIGFAKIGSVLSTYADTNQDGTPDPGFDSCNTAQLPDAMLREVGSGMTLAVGSLAASGGSVGSSLAISVTAACAALSSVNPIYDFCTVTVPASFSVDQVRALGGLVKSTDNPGIGTCAGSLATCVCP